MHVHDWYAIQSHLSEDKEPHNKINVVNIVLAITFTVIGI